MPLTLSGFPPDSVNAYLIRDHEGYTIVDTGVDSEPSVQSVNEQLAEIGASMKDIKRAILTHSHIDHLGLIPRLIQDYHTQIYIHQKEIRPY